MEITRAGFLGTIAVFVVVGVCVRLGFWQLDRREQRLDRNAVMAARMAEPAIPLEVVPTDTTGLTFRHVVAHGDYDYDRPIVLAGRSRGGIPGVHVLAPLRISGGALLVNLGWLPSPDAATVDLDSIRAERTARVDGILMPFPDADLDPPAESFRTTWFRLDGDAIRAQYPYAVAPLYLVRTRAATPDRPRTASANTQPIPLGPPELTAGPHLSYAIQWFSFALIFLVGWGALAVRRTRTST